MFQQNEYTRALLVSLIVYNIFYIPTTILFYLRRNHVLIKQRLTTLALFSAICGIYTGNAGLTAIYIWSPYLNLQCWQRLMQLYFGPPTFMFTMFLRTAVLIRMYTVQKMKLNTTYKPTYIELTILKVLSSISHKRLIGKISRASTFNTATSSVSESSNKKSSGNDNVPAPDSAEISIDKESKKTKGIKFSDSSTVMLTTMFVLLNLVLLIAMLFSAPEQIHQADCYVYQGIGSIVLQLVFVVLTPILLYAMKDSKDKIFLRSEIAINCAVCFVCTIMVTILIYDGSEPTNLLGDPFFWDVLRCVVSQLLMIVYPLGVSYYRDYRYGFMDKDYDYQDMIRVLEDPKKKLIFTVILAKQYCLENMKFYEACRKYTRKQYKWKPEVAHKELKTIMDTFIVEKAPYELNIPGKLRREFIEAMSTPPPYTAANLPSLENIKKEVLKMMYLNTYPIYLKDKDKMAQSGNLIAKSGNEFTKNASSNVLGKISKTEIDDDPEIVENNSNSLKVPALPRANRSLSIGNVGSEKK